MLGLAAIKRGEKDDSGSRTSHSGKGQMGRDALMEEYRTLVDMHCNLFGLNYTQVWPFPGVLGRIDELERMLFGDDDDCSDNGGEQSRFNFSG